jgi:hypothetical protein
MSTVTYDDVRRQAEQLSPDERVALLEFLQETLIRQWSQISQQRQEEMAHKWSAQIAKYLETTSEESVKGRITQWLLASSEETHALSFIISVAAAFASQRSSRVTRETLLAELEQLRSEGAFEGVESLRNKYADPPLELSDNELRAGIRDFSKEWEHDLDDLFDDD